MAPGSHTVVNRVNMARCPKFAFELTLSGPQPSERITVKVILSKTHFIVNWDPAKNILDLDITYSL